MALAAWRRRGVDHDRQLALPLPPALGVADQVAHEARNIRPARAPRPEHARDERPVERVVRGARRELAVEQRVRTDGDPLQGGARGADFAAEEVGGALFVEGDLSGTTDSPRIEAIAFASNMHYLNFPLDTLESSIIFKDTTLIINSSRFAGSFQAADHDRPLLDIDSLYTDFDYSGSFSGTLESPEAIIDARFSKSGYGAYFVDSADIHVAVNGKDSVFHRVIYTRRPCIPISKVSSIYSACRGI